MDMTGVFNSTDYFSNVLANQDFYKGFKLKIWLYVWLGSKQNTFEGEERYKDRARQGEYFDNHTEVVRRQFDIWKQKQSQSTFRKLRVESKVYINT